MLLDIQILEHIWQSCEVMNQFFSFTTLCPILAISAKAVYDTLFDFVFWTEKYWSMALKQAEKEPPPKSYWKKIISFFSPSEDQTNNEPDPATQNRKFHRWPGLRCKRRSTYRLRHGVLWGITRRWQDGVELLFKGVIERYTDSEKLENAALRIHDILTQAESGKVEFTVTWCWNSFVARLLASSMAEIARDTGDVARSLSWLMGDCLV